MKRVPESSRQKLSSFAMPVLICCIFALGLLLRLWGIDWGLPNNLHSFTYHPDEFIQLAAASNVNLFSLDLNPHFFNYPSFYIYLTSFVVSVGSVWGGISNLSDGFLAARLIAAIMGAITVFPVYYAGSRWFGKLAGFIAAFLVAVIPLSVVHSHFATVDVPAAFWVAVCVAATAYLLGSFSARNCLLAGLAAGFAAGTKYNAGLIVIAPIVASVSAVYGKPIEKIINRKTILVVAGSLIGFLITTPGTVLWHSEFMKQFLFELRHAGSGHGLVFQNTGPGWLYTFTSTFLCGLGTPLALLSLIAVGYAAVKRDRGDLPLVAFFAVYYILISSSEVRFARYAMPLVPVIALLVGRMLADMLCGPRRVLWTILVAFVMIQVTGYSLALDRLFASPDPRESAIVWIGRNVPDGTRIALANPPWFYTPPFSPGFGQLAKQDRMDSAQKSDYSLVMSHRDWDTSVLDARPAFVILTDYERLDGERSGDRDAGRFLRKLYDEYRLGRSFGNHWAYWNPPYVLPQQLPHDMKYMYPTVEIWERK